MSEQTMLRALLVILGTAAAAAGIWFLTLVGYFELVEPYLFPPKPGHGFNSVAFVLLLFGTPLVALAGAAVGVWLLLRRKRPSHP